MRKFTLLFISISTIIFSCKKTDITPVTPEPAPKAEFSYIVGSDGKVGLTNLSLNATSYSWSYGDLSTENTSSPSTFIHQYSRNGTYQIGLTAKGKGGSDIIVKSIYVSSVKGSLVVYKKFGTGNSNINVYVDGNYAGAINGSYYQANGAECGNQYAVTIYNLSEGSHKIDAKETAFLLPRSWSGSTSVVGGSCSSFGLTL